nr:type II toxin-antitoxin system PemK/MazF family toxin [Cellulomonas hominis]
MRAPKATQGHEQRGPRYAVVVQTDRFALSTLLVAPTSTSVTPTVFRPRISLNGTTTYVLVEQTTAVNADTRLGDFAGRLEPGELTDVDAALRLVLDLR